NKTSPNYGSYDFWVVRLNSSGVKLWDQSFGGSDDDGTAGMAIRQTSDGGFIVGGDSRSPATGSKTSPNYGGADFWVIRMDSNGSELWEQSFGGSSEDRLAALQQTSDGGFILGGSSSSSPGGNKVSTKYVSFDFCLVRLDWNGNKLWDQSFGGIGSDQLFSLQIASDGGYILGGSSSSPAGGNKTTSNFGSSDFWVVKTDANGSKLWEQNYGGSLS